MVHPLLRTMIQLSGQRLILPFWHGVAPETPAHIRHIYQFPRPAHFAQTIDDLLVHYRPLSFEQLLEVANGKPLNKPSMFLSFDDGLSEVGRYALPILQEKGVPSAVFVNPSFVDQQGLFFRYQASLVIDQVSTLPSASLSHHPLVSLLDLEIGSPATIKQAILSLGYQDRPLITKLLQILGIAPIDYLSQQQPYMSLDTIKSWAAKGVVFGGHSMDHPLYAELDLSDQLAQTLDSVNWVQTHVPDQPAIFAFPFTDYQVSTRFFEETLDRNALLMSFGTAGLKTDIRPTHLHRIPMEKGSSNAMVRLVREYMYYLAKKPFGRNQMHRTSI